MMTAMLASLETAANKGDCGALRHPPLLTLDPADALQSLDILIRGMWVKGGLHRLELVLLASEGDSLSMEATAFVPDAALNFGISHPFFIGYIGCLECVRFAIDAHTEKFYFEPVP
ncbi:MAG TPA: hypothetical protein VIH58_12295 [Chthoniobacterales bacterium]|jgi:hypothetical protein